MKAYLDYAATTPLHPLVWQVMKPYFTTKFGNPSSLHLWGQEARKAVEAARGQVAQVLGCCSAELYFTGTTTTSDNLAIQGVAKASQRLRKGNQLVTSAVEHHAVLDTVKALGQQGFKTTILPVDQYGLVDLGQLAKAISSQTILVSIMYANNEMGTIQPIEAISRITRKKGVYLHTDAATVADYLPLQVDKLGVDLLTLGAHKFGGPKGVGVLYVRRGVAIDPLTYGGHHERGLWPGTEAVPLIVGLARALQIAAQETPEAARKVSRLRDKLIKGVLQKIPDSYLTGHPTQRLPDIASFVIKGAEGEAMLLGLFDQNIAASSGSACTSGVLKPSHVLLAMGIPAEEAHGSLRFSLGKQTTAAEIDYALKVLPQVVRRLRKMAPKLKETK